MTLVSSLKLIDFPRYYNEPLEDYIPKLLTSLELLRDTIADSADTQTILDSAGRVITDSAGHRIYDGDGDAVVDGTIWAIDSGHITTSGITASSIANQAITEGTREWLASESALATSPVVAASASATWSEGYALILAGAAYGFIPTATAGLRLTARLKRDSTTLVEQQAAIAYATSEEELGRFELSYLDTGATGEHDWSLEFELGATSFASSFISNRHIAVIQGKT